MSGNPEAARRALGPHLAGVPDGGYARIWTADGGADVYGVGSGSLMINHADGEAIWQVMVYVAMAADWVIMPAGGCACVMGEEMISELPAELQDDAVVVRSGAQLLDVIARA